MRRLLDWLGAGAGAASIVGGAWWAQQLSGWDGDDLRLTVCVVFIAGGLSILWRYE